MGAQNITLLLFLLSGAASLFFRIRYDIATAGIRSGKNDTEQTRRRQQRMFRCQLVCTICTILFLAVCILQGVFKSRGL